MAVDCSSDEHFANKVAIDVSQRTEHNYRAIQLIDLITSDCLLGS